MQSQSARRKEMVEKLSDRSLNGLLGRGARRHTFAAGQRLGILGPRDALLLVLALAVGRLDDPVVVRGDAQIEGPLLVVEAQLAGEAAMGEVAGEEEL
jgi:hypothetical protein